MPAIFALVLLIHGSSALAQGSILSSVAIGNGLTRYAPGDTLLVAITLTNYGGADRTDVLVNYAIVNEAGRDVYSENETIAVQTASGFMHSITIPAGLRSGEYTVTSSVSYPGQVSPAASSFRITIEPKIMGIFAIDLLLYALAIIALAIVSALIGKRYAQKRTGRNAPLEYENIPSQERVFYEIASDIIAQIRYRIGNRALELAGEIPGLKIDKRTGRILKLTKDPAEVIAMLMYKYEKFLGKKILATPKPVEKNLAGILRPINQNLSIIEKYFKSNPK